MENLKLDAKVGPRENLIFFHSHFIKKVTFFILKRIQQYSKIDIFFMVIILDLDTSSAVQIISRKIGVRPNNVGVAGNKDKRGITTQKMTLFKVEASKLAALNGNTTNILVGDFKYVDNSLGLGDLHGNRFDVAIREVDADEQAIEKAVESLKTNGFINYYGLQRFGTGTVKTHEIGIALLKEDFEGAVKLIMNPHMKSSESAIK